MFTKETISVHKICNILRGEDKNDSGKTLPLSFFSLFYYRKRRPGVKGQILSHLWIGSGVSASGTC